MNFLIVSSLSYICRQIILSRIIAHVNSQCSNFGIVNAGWTDAATHFIDLGIREEQREVL
ncbi:MAG: hypothetical protein A2W25_06460 [candidate division Zixibacteria bacterium RBG_16_53_22]|nr:MAG: hypothetical protein A2W25_06460 [candidate division Zixibacteria bacterium RBG_16_53_22]